MTDYTQKLGWQGDPLPPGAQGVIVITKFAAACAVMEANFRKLNAEISALLKDSTPNDMSDQLDQHPFYRAVMQHLNAETTDELFRMNAQELYDLVRGYNAATILSLAIAIWVTDGAGLPDEILDMARRQEQEGE